MQVLERERAARASWKPMNIRLLFCRLIALFLILCVVSTEVSSSGFLVSCSMPQSLTRNQRLGTRNSLFAEQAFAARATQFISQLSPEMKVWVTQLAFAALGALAAHYGHPALGVLAMVAPKSSKHFTGNGSSLNVALQALFQEYHAGQIDLSDSQMNEALGLRIAQTEKEIAVDVHRPHRGEAWIYVASHFNILRVALQMLNLTAEDVFYDLGAGYFQALFYARLATIVGLSKGVEIVSQRVEEARRVQVEHAIDSIEIIEGSIRDTDIGEGTAFFFYSPFNEESLEIALRKLLAAARRHPDVFRILVYGPAATVFMQQPWLKPVLWKQVVTQNLLLFRAHNPDSYEFPERSPSPEILFQTKTPTGSSFMNLNRAG